MGFDGSSGQGQIVALPAFTVSILTTPEAMVNSRQRCLTVIYKIHSHSRTAQSSYKQEKNSQK